MMMNRRFRNVISLLFFLLTSAQLKAQYFDSLLNVLDTRYPQEKIYLHTDKSYYNTGETIWFKAYILADNLPASISKTLYAELLDDKGIILQQKKMPVFESGAASNFEVPDSMVSTKLYIRAYTGWMLNFDSSLIYLKPITVIPAKTTGKKTVQTLTYSLQFFPEGGDMLNDVSSRLAFKATDNQGTPIAVKGDISDSKGKKITSFAAVHDGMGYVTITPATGEKYTAIWKDKKGVQHETVLPASKAQGLALSANFTDNQLKYTLNRPENPEPDFTSFFVVAQMQQRLVYSAMINLSKKTTVTAPIDTDSLQTGVLQITVFNAAKVPVAERLVFINHNNYSFITDLHAVENNLAKRARNVLQIDVGGKLLANLSVSVTDAGLNPVTKNEENIYSQFLVSCDLKGYVYNAGYYFTAEGDSVMQNLDLVMMTNGWRRFKWEDVMAEKWPVIRNAPEGYLSVKGKVLGLTKALLYERQMTGILTTKNGGSKFFSMPFSNQGDFMVDNLYFFDTAKLYYQINNDKDKVLTDKASFSFVNGFLKSPLASAGGLAALYSPEKVDSSTITKSAAIAMLRRSQAEMNKTKTLETVVITTKVKSLKERLEKEYTSGMFTGGDGYTFTTEDDPFAKSAISVLSYLQGKVAGLQINTNGNGEATWRGSATSFFLNEMNTDVQNLQSINMNDVALIKVFRPPFFGSTGGGAGGAIAVYTKKGSSLNSMAKGLPFTQVSGYSPVKEFYSPNYETNPEPGLKDYRATLYWNPRLYFDKNTRRVTIPFFNSDNCKKIRVIIEGLNEAGEMTREEKYIE